MSDTNKVRFGLKNVYVAELSFDESGVPTYATPKKIPGAVNLSLDAEGSTEPFYADNVKYYVSESNDGYTGDLEIAEMPDWFAVDYLAQLKSSNGLLVEQSDMTSKKSFALLFQFEGDKKATRHIVYNITVSRPKIEGKTKEDKIEVATDTLSLTAIPLEVSDKSIVKAKTIPGETDDTTYTTWFTKAPVVPTFTEAEG